MAKSSIVYELELTFPHCKTYYHNVTGAKFALWTEYMKIYPDDAEDIKASWKQLRDEWSISGFGEIRPIVPTDDITYCD